MSNLTTRQTIKVKVNQLDGSLVPQNKMPVVLKNTAQESIGLSGLSNVNEGTPAQGETLVYNSNTQQYDVRPLTMRDLGDVVGAPANGDVLIFNAASNTFLYGTKPQTLSALTDVNANTRPNGSVLTYNSATNTYIHANVITSGSAVNAGTLTIGNVTVNSISSFSNTTQLGTLNTGADYELVTARAIKNYIDTVVASSGSGGGGAATLDGLLDVFLNGGGLINRQVLLYDGARNEWVNRDIHGVANNIAMRTNSNNDIVIALANDVNIANSLNVPTANVTTLQVGLLTSAGNVVVGGTLGVANQLTVARAATFSNTVAVGGQLTVNGTSTFSNTLTIQANAVIGQQLTVNTVSVQSSLNTFGSVNFSNTSATIEFGARVASNILPAANNTYSLGSANMRFKDLFISGGTLYLGNVVVSAEDGDFTVSSNMVVEGTTTYVSNADFAAGLSVAQTAVFQGNVVLGSNTQDVITVNGFLGSNVVPSANGTLNLGTSNNRMATVFANNVNGTHGNFGDLTVSGNLVVEGDLTRVNVSTMIVEDPLIQLSSNNASSDLVDIGFFGNYYDGTIGRYTGLFRDASDSGKYVLFANLHSTALPSATVNRTSPSFSLSTLVAYLESGGLTSSPTQIRILANNSLSVDISANTLSLTTPLAVSSGGTGRSTLTLNAVLVGNGSSTVRQVSATQQNQVLSIVSGVPTFVSSLDAGEY